MKRVRLHLRMLKLSAQMLFLSFVEPHVLPANRSMLRMARHVLAAEIFEKTGYDWFARERDDR